MSGVGITGTRKGLTVPQIRTLTAVLTSEFTERGDPCLLHHGDCVGADAVAANIGRNCGFVIIGHPPTDTKLRAYFPSDLERAPQAYLDRNRAIVKACDVLIGCPGGPQELRSGTWSTIRFALKIGRGVVVVMPDGTQETL